MKRYHATITVSLDAADEVTARHLLGLFVSEGQSSLQYEGQLTPGQVFVATVRKIEERQPRTKRCPDCQGAGKVRGGALYPGRHAARPMVDCRTCKGTGRVEVGP